MQQGQRRHAARAGMGLARDRALLWLLVLGVVGGTAGAAGAPCPQQKLLQARPEELGVTHARILGAVRNSWTGKMDPVVLHAFLRLVQTRHGTKHLYGIGWVEGTVTGKKLFMPEHVQYVSNLPGFTLQPVSVRGSPIGKALRVGNTHGMTGDTLRMGFRLELIFESDETHFLFGLKGWDRSFSLSVDCDVKPGAVLPWYKLDAAAATPSSGVSPPVGMQLGSTASAAKRHVAAERSGGARRRRSLLEWARDGAESALVWLSGRSTGLVGRRRRLLDDHEAHHDGSHDDSVTEVPVGEAAGGNVNATALQAPAGRNGSSNSSSSSSGQAWAVEVKALAGRLKNATAPVAELATRLPGVDDGSGNARPPLAVVITLAFGPAADLASSVHYAQQFVRHVEHHLGELQMQRVLVYICEALYKHAPFREYVARHLPRELLPYVTFVVWNEFVVTSNPWYDQYVKYFHGVVSLWGHGGVLAALIDIDEYIAFPGPRTTLHEALDRCNATQLDWVRLANHFVVCERCVDQYKKLNKRHGGGTTDLALWAERARPEFQLALPPPAPPPPAAAHKPKKGRGFLSRRLRGEADVQEEEEGGGEQCRWWREDPLLNYTRRWNSRWYKEKWGERYPQAAPLGDDEAAFPAYVFSTFQSKQLIRPEAAVAFMHHRGEVLPKKRQAWLDPRHCPYIAHLVHSNGFRPWRLGARIEFFDGPPRRVDWWLLDQPR